MLRVGMDQMINCTNSVFKLSNLVAKRAQELSQGSSNLIGESVTEKPVTVALKEVLDKRVSFKLVEKEEKE